MKLRRLLSRLWPRSLTAQLVCLLLGAIILTHIVLGVLLAEERRDALVSERRGNALSRVAAISRILASTPEENWRYVLRVAQSPQSRLRLVDETQIENAEKLISDGLAARLNEFLDIPPQNENRARVGILSEGECLSEKRDLKHARKQAFKDGHDKKDDDHKDREDPKSVIEKVLEKHQSRNRDFETDGHDGAAILWSMRYLEHFDCHTAPVMQLAVPIFSSLPVPGGDVADDNRPANAQPKVWLEAMIGGVMPPPFLVWDNLLRVVISAGVIAIIAFVLARRISRSWAVLTRAADRVGRGDYPEPVPETGPLEIRRAAKAFNRMTARLKRFVEDRTRMLAAISHDLRTPITSLRLRAEFVDDPENRARIIETLDEMEQMVEAAMTFAREETANEETRKIDITALVETSVEDLFETGRPIRFSGDATARVYPCRPLSIKRAFGNLVANALAFGSQVEVGIRDADDGGVWIEIADDGPGIPVDQREQVFEPFFRIEQSRNRDTGGIGLGMAIARTAIRAHGGEIYLEEADLGGLLARIYLPPIRS